MITQNDYGSFETSEIADGTTVKLSDLFRAVRLAAASGVQRPGQAIMNIASVIGLPGACRGPWPKLWSMTGFAESFTGFFTRYDVDDRGWVIPNGVDL
jgi:hypothetical protein